MQSFEIKIEPFNINVLVHYGPTMKKIIEHHNQHYEPQIQPETRFTKAIVNIEHTDRGPVFCLLLPKKTYNDGVLVHECLHIIHETADYVGLTLTDSSQEYYAYALERLFNEIKKKLEL